MTSRPGSATPVFLALLVALFSLTAASDTFTCEFTGSCPELTLLSPTGTWGLTYDGWANFNVGARDTWGALELRTSAQFVGDFMATTSAKPGNLGFAGAALSLIAWFDTVTPYWVAVYFQSDGIHSFYNLPGSSGHDGPHGNPAAAGLQIRRESGTLHLEYDLGSGFQASQNVVADGPVYLGLRLFHPGGQQAMDGAFDFLTITGTPREVTPIPEPAAIWLFGGVLASLALRRLRRA